MLPGSKDNPSLGLELELEVGSEATEELPPPQEIRIANNTIYNIFINSPLLKKKPLLFEESL